MNVPVRWENPASSTYCCDPQLLTLKSSRCNKPERQRPNLIKSNIHPLTSMFTMNIFPSASFQETVGNLELSEADKLKHFQACQLLHCMILKVIFLWDFRNALILVQNKNGKTWTHEPFPLISPSRQTKCVLARCVHYYSSIFPSLPVLWKKAHPNKTSQAWVRKEGNGTASL